MTRQHHQDKRPVRRYAEGVWVRGRGSRPVPTLLGAALIGLAALFVGGQAPAGVLVGPGQDGFDREVGSVVDRGQPRVDYELFRPPGHDSGDALPLVVYLHGFGDGRPTRQARLNDTVRGLVHATQRDNASRGPGACSDTGGGSDSCSSQDEAYASYLLVPKVPLAQSWSTRFATLHSIIDDVLSRYNIDDRRAYLTGFSDGGFATPRFISQFPDLFAAAVPISGGGAPSTFDIEALSETPWWFFHGTSDPVVNSDNSINLAREIRRAGGEARLSLVRGGGHNSGYELAYPDLNNEFYPWLFSQSLPILVPEPASAFVLCVGVFCGCSPHRRSASSRGESGGESNGFGGVSQPRSRRE